MRYILEEIEADEDEVKVLIEANWRIPIRENAARLNLLNSTVYDRTWNDLVFRCREKKTRLLFEQPIQMRLIAKIFKWKSDIFSIQRE